ncbi:MAG: NfeD family protein [Oscillospiraceae bacterium]|nr:NfeD family protein [Oscillospiraceae bacterium]
MGFVYFWLALMVACMIIEAMTAGFYTTWFAVGAMLAAVCAGFGLNFYIQFVVFLAVSILLLLLLRPIVKTYFNVKKTATNADRVMEKIGVVTEDIDNTYGHGAIYIDGKTWTARSYGGEPITKNTNVSVKLVDGVKLIVEPVAENTAPVA